MPTTNTILAIIPNSESEVHYNKISIDATISSTLRQLGIRPKFTGYDYLKTAIKMCYENSDEYTSLITKHLYPDIASLYRVKSSAVERSIRYAISGMTCSDCIKEQIIGYASDKYSNKEFINCLLEYIRYL